MHFTTLYLLKNEELTNVGISQIEEDFRDRFCYCCGETHPRYRYWCDWFQIGGRWTDILVAKKGIKGEHSWCNQNEKTPKNHFSIVEIKDLTKPINKDMIYAVATKSRIYQCSSEWAGGKPDKDKFDELLDKINNKQIKGVIALIDCHD